MHVLFISNFFDAELEGADALLDRYQSLTGWAEGLRAAGAEVSVLQRFHEDQLVERRGITYRLVSDRHGPRLRLSQIPHRLHRLAQYLCAQSIGAGTPTVVHIHALVFPLQTRALRAALPNESAIVAQHHAEKPWQGWRKIIQRWGLGAVDGFFFAADELAQPWLEQGLIRSARDVYQIMEGSTWFSPQARAAARAVTGMCGDPVVLWVGRLDQNKDPLTVLEGFEQTLERHPQARLYMVYSSKDLLPEVQARIATSTALGPAVELLGRLPHVQMEHYYRSADYFVLGSHYEGSGYALAEALACGVVPVVTDIPSFRVMTDGGAIGALWSPGDTNAFTAAMLDVLSRPLASQAAAARSFFEAHLSFPAIGRRAFTIYQELASRRIRLGE